jgi:hypothetical protein
MLGKIQPTWGTDSADVATIKDSVKTLYNTVSFRVDQKLRWN